MEGWFCFWAGEGRGRVVVMMIGEKFSLRGGFLQFA